MAPDLCHRRVLLFLAACVIIHQNDCTVMSGVGWGGVCANVDNVVSANCTSVVCKVAKLAWFAMLNTTGFVSSLLASNAGRETLDSGDNPVRFCGADLGHSGEHSGEK